MPERAGPRHPDSAERVGWPGSGQAGCSLCWILGLIHQPPVQASDWYGLQTFKDSAA